MERHALRTTGKIDWENKKPLKIGIISDFVKDHLEYLIIESGFAKEPLDSAKRTINQKTNSSRNAFCASFVQRKVRARVIAKAADSIAVANLNNLKQLSDQKIGSERQQQHLIYIPGYDVASRLSDPIAPTYF
tara:strand:+ start:86 stop:484 length:399 start_codon:yes stop_codon:yes gene_type:complete